MVPNWQDYHDLKAMVSWFVGKSPRPKLQLDRYAYYEKGEFWAASGGVTHHVRHRRHPLVSRGGRAVPARAS